MNNFLNLNLYFYLFFLFFVKTKAPKDINIPLADKSKPESKVFIIPYTLVPCLSVPATSFIFIILMLCPFYLLIMAKHADPQSVISRYFTQ